MKFLHLLPLAGATAALVLPDAQVFEELDVQRSHVAHEATSSALEIENRLESFIDKYNEQLHNAFAELSGKATNAIDDAISKSQQAGRLVSGFAQDRAFEANSWLSSSHETLLDTEANLASMFEEPPDEPPPHGGPPPPGRPPHRRPPHGRPPHRGPPCKHKPEKTVYELIASSKYTTKLAKLINKFPDLVEALNGTKANYTVFAPTDYAFEKIPEHAPKPSEKFLKAILSYHVSSDFYPASRVLTTRTIPTLLESDELADEPLPQRIVTQIGFRGLTANFYSRIIAVNIFGTNGVIHGLDSLLLPPPEAIQAIELLPSAFSTLDLGLTKSGLLEELKEAPHKGSTVFAPTNSAFARLGPGINAFLFSPHGLKYLKALLQYHIVHNQTVYSDAYYPGGSHGDNADAENVPKGRTHYDLPTLLEGKNLAVDIARFGRLIEIKLNAFFRVAITDGVARDGVIHTVSSVLIPPKTGGESSDYDGSQELTVEELIERLEPAVTRDVHADDL